MSRTICITLTIATVLTACQTAPEPQRTDAANQCAPFALDTAGWQLVERSSFTFRVPPDFREAAVQGIDSDVAQFEASDGSAFVSTDLGWYSNDLSHDASVYEQYESCTTTIGGKPAVVVTGTLRERTESGAARYVAAAAWRDIQARRDDSDMPVHLTMWGEVQDRTRFQDVLTVLHTVRFRN
ncbi:MAG TPA: hypothetical protein VHG09_00740 [Longimicrobiales bacterium]|nr:hypothetical protein [Longimicrobiales bacterium]